MPLSSEARLDPNVHLHMLVGNAVCLAACSIYISLARSAGRFLHGQTGVCCKQQEHTLDYQWLA